MDAIARVSIGKGQEDQTVEGKNLIRYLPDFILHHILSFLPMKDVVKTSILSKRWKNLWMDVPNFKFLESWSRDREHMMDFVDRVMLRRDSLDIRKFSLSWDVYSDASRINAWIFAALSLKVQELELNLDEFDADESFMLPHCLFTSQSLTLLKLDLSYELKLPSNICLPNLKNLKLSKVTFVDDHSTQLFDGCPNLQELYLCDCAWKDVKFVCISSPMLKFLSICDLLDEGDPPSDCQIVICGTNLKYFSYYGDLKTVFCLYSSSLVEGCIELEFRAISEWDGKEREAAYRVHKLLMGLTGVENLEASSVVLEVLSNAEELHPHLPVFHMQVFDKLTHIKFPYNFVPLHVDCGIFQRLLHNWPHLDCLDFEPVISLSEEYEINDFVLDPVPPCLLTLLKTIKIHLFSGIETIKVLLEVSAVLEKMYIWGGLSMQKEIALLSRRSTICEIVYL